MEHTLIIPEDLVNKLNDAQKDKAIVNKWASIAIMNPTDMIDRIIAELNSSNEKLQIKGYRVEDKTIIKGRIENPGNPSQYTGYLEDNEGFIKGLFFYIPPNLNSGNDILTRQVMPVLLGIYSSVGDNLRTIRFNCKPIYIVNICETARSTQNAVKITFIGADILGFNYIDVFGRSYKDIVIPVNSSEAINNIYEYDRLINGSNIFTIDAANSKIILNDSTLSGSTNLTADIYRFCMKAIPAAYLAAQEQFHVDATKLLPLSNDIINMLFKYFEKI